MRLVQDSTALLMGRRRVMIDLAMPARLTCLTVREITFTLEINYQTPKSSRYQYGIDLTKTRFRGFFTTRLFLLLVVLESSTNLVNWAATGLAFTAISENYTNEFVIVETGSFFRLREVP